MKDAEKIIGSSNIKTAMYALTNRPDLRIDFLIREETTFIEKLTKARISIRARLFIVNNIGILLTMFQINNELLNTYKVFWDYYLEGDRGRFAFDLMASQPDIAFHFYGNSKTIEKSILTANSFRNFFKAAIEKIKELPPWNSEQFEIQKEEILKSYPTTEQLWEAAK
ncbi:MAG: hypothetical protein N2511_07420 [Thermodesulfovibrionales bacterium]|nr:hypothetical protein [Thermodesulfovibrionales bacterium]